MLECPTGFYAKVGDLTCRRTLQISNQCPFGYYSYSSTPNSHASENLYSCLNYNYFSGTNNAVASSIGQCKIGTYTPMTHDACVVSPPGYIMPSNNVNTYNSNDQCPYGFYCGIAFDYKENLYSLHTRRCPPGTYIRTGFTGGKFEDETCTRCPPGFYCPGNSAKIACPTSYICEAGTDTPYLTCPLGFYYDTTKTDTYMYGRCVQCPANYYCPLKSTESTKEDCPTGYTCGIQTMDPYAYPSKSGTYIDSSGGTETSCPAGYYCPPNSTSPIACPKGYYSISTDNSWQDDCDLCPMGLLCDTVGLSTYPTTSCTAGHFCPQGSQAERSCPPGTYNSATGGVSEDSCTACPAGSACVEGSSATSACAQGHYCLIRSYDPKETPCPGGTYSSATNLVSKSSCSPCNTAGKYCLEGSVAETSCEKGYFCPGNQAGRQICPAGTYSNAGASGCTACPKGSICPEEYYELNPISCPPGYFMSSLSSSGPCTPCTEGKKCATSGLETPVDCPDGEWSISGSASCNQCPPGYACKSGVKTVCTSGYYCPAGTSDPTQCEEGYYCPTGTANHIPCPPGTHSAATAATCSSSTAGHYTKQGQSTSTMNLNKCKGGFYCELESKGSIHKPCPPGTFSDEDFNILNSCAACTAGYYCMEGTQTSTRIICPTGHYCPEGSAIPTKCPVGSHRSTTGGTELNSCDPCPAGSICTQMGLTDPDGTCDPGYYCKLGATDSQPRDDSIGGYCTEGAYCPRGTAAPINCQSGTFNVFKGCTSQDDCLECPFGFICNDNTGTNLLCPEGYYCPGGTSDSTKQPAQAGYHTISGQGAQIPCIPSLFTDTTNKASCDSCTAGFYCPSAGTFSPTVCPAGSYCDSQTVQPKKCPEGTFRASTGATNVNDCTSCTAGKYCAEVGLTEVSGDCSAGFYCTEGGIHAMAAYDVDSTRKIFGKCPPGKYCEEGTSIPTNCPVGTFSPASCNKASSDCNSCIPGEYCGQTGLTSPSGNCQQGYYCVEGSSTVNPTQCSSGYYCPTGSFQMLKCVAGTYTSSSGTVTCTDCPASKYCPTGSSGTTACPAGYYCPINTGEYFLYPCAPGTFSSSTGLSTSGDCTACTAGKYCTVYALTAETGDCDAGYYCTASARFARPTTTTEGGMCTAGQICPTRSSAPQNCPATYVCNEEAMSSSTLKCYHGFKCGEGLSIMAPAGVSSDSDLCDKGKWCQNGIQTNCAKKYYLPSRGAGSTGVSECLSCPYGYYCESEGLESPTAVCPAGYYCLAQQELGTENACAAGYYCPLGSFQKISCPAGQFQSATGQSSCIDCTSGHFCQFNSVSGTPAQTLCPAGYKCVSTKLDHTEPCSPGEYQALTGQTTCSSVTSGYYTLSYGSAAQILCPGGYYCNAGATNGKLNRCEPGYYCPEGSSAPVPCDAGKYCSGYALSAPSGTCEKGYYCISKATVPNPTDGTTGNLCPEGYYCPDGLAKTPCAIGTYNENQGSDEVGDCLACPPGKMCTTEGLTYPTTNCAAGKYCAVGTAAVDCSAGYACPEGSVAPILCLAGTYQDSTGQANCLTCPAGYYCNFDNGITVKKNCPVGYYCPAGTGNYESFPCAKGSFGASTNLQASTECTACTETKYCLNKGLSAVSGSCSDGFLCPEGSILPNNPDNYCPSNYYCIAGVKTSCPTTQYTYSGVLGADKASNCMDCVAGKMCPSGSTNQISCPEGYYCNHGIQTICEQGRYCPTGSFLSTKCYYGYYAPNAGMAACLACPAGSSCFSFGSTSYSSCPTNLVCEEASVRALPCDYGYYPVNNVCVQCPAGKWCYKSSTNNIQGDCDDGFQCYLGASSPTPFYSKSMNSSDAQYQQYNGRAAKGCYSSSSSGALNYKCPLGKYMPSYGATECVDCPPGHYCDELGLSDVTSKRCSGGYLCIKGSASATPTDGITGSLCPQHCYCEENTGFAERCKDGTMAPNGGAEICSTCSEGKSCSYDYPYKTCRTNNQCTAGTGVEPLCPKGYYLSSDECVSCPAGLYCVDGRSEASVSDCSHGQCCTAGYYCSGGAESSKPSSVGGSACPVGYYCPEGSTAPTNCPATTYTFSQGAIQVTDCTECQEGYICESNVPVACYKGSYCPTGTTGAVACPNGTYSETNTNTLVHDCYSCPKGHLCGVSESEVVGVSNYNEYSCPMGKYCFERATFGIDCPYGTYRNLTGGSTIDDCFPCPMGYKCKDKGISDLANYQCEGGEMCPLGTAFAAACPMGYYCSSETNYNKVKCPVNYYCPGSTGIPISCSSGEYCPEGSGYPTKCVSGQSSEIVDGALVCTTCPGGTYSVIGIVDTCEPCTAGYVCLGGTSAQYPYNIATHNGYKCPQGHYCPKGSSAAIPCPAGSYNPYEGMGESINCILCQENTFSPDLGQTACLPCGESAYAEKGWSKCKCKGKNRAFLPGDSSCRCKPGYEYIENGETQSDANSKVDCQPIVYDRCSSTQVRTEDGQCKDKDDCSSSCSGSSGTRSPTLGICECASTQQIEKVCNKGCRSSVPTMTVDSNGQIAVYDSSDTEKTSPTTVSASQLSNFNRQYMSCSGDDECNAVSVKFSNTGSVSATYGLGPTLREEYLQATSGSRRLLASEERKRLLDSLGSDLINNPVICIRKGDSLIFEVDGDGHYPVYQKDSLLNSNSEFDYAAFKILSETAQAQVASGTSHSGYFGYTFQTAGRYYFTDSIDTTQTMIVYVTSDSENCPNEDQVVQSRTTAILSTFGLAINESITLEPDYIMIAIIICCFIGSLAMMLFLLKWVSEHMWDPKPAAKPKFRNENKEFDLSKIRYLSTSERLQGSSDREHSANESFIPNIIDGVNTQKLEELDPFIIDKILTDYSQYKNYLQHELLASCERQNKEIGEMNNTIESIRYMLNERYEKLIAIMKLDVDYMKLKGVRISAAEEKEELKARERKVKPSDLVLAEGEERKATEVMKKIVANKTELNLLESEESSRKPKKASMLEGIEDPLKQEFEDRLKIMSDFSEAEKNKVKDDFETELLNMEYILAGEREQQEITVRRLIQQRRKRVTDRKKEIENFNASLLSPDEEIIKQNVEKEVDEEMRDRTQDIEARTIAKLDRCKETFMNKLGISKSLSEKKRTSSCESTIQSQRQFIKK